MGGDRSQTFVGCLLVLVVSLSQPLLVCTWLKTKQTSESSRLSALFLLKLESWWCRENNTIMSFDNLTMTSVTLHSGLKPPPPLATAKFIDTNSNKAIEPTHTITSDHHQLHHHQKAAMPSPRKSVEFILHPPPSKRSKLDTTWTAKQVVDGKSHCNSILFRDRNECFPKHYGRKRDSCCIARMADLLSCDFV